MVNGEQDKTLSRRSMLKTSAGVGIGAALTGAIGATAAAGSSGNKTRPARFRLQSQDGTRITFGLPWDAITLNPIVEQDGVSYLVNLWIFDALIRLDNSLQPVPELAESWSASEDGLTWEIKLRQGVTWHDGTPFSADDVAFTVYKILDPTTQTQYRGNFSALVGYAELTDPDAPVTPEQLPQAPVEVVDPSTVRFHLAAPFAPFLVQSLHLPIAPKHLLADVDVNQAEFNTKPVGTGAWQFVDWQKDNRLVLKAYDGYYGGRPQLDELVLRVIPDETVLLQELRTGGIEFMERVPREAVADLQSSPEYQVALVDNVGCSFISFNTTHPVLSDKAVRQAVGCAVDMATFIDAVLLGLALPATGLYPPYTWMYEPDVRKYTYDPAQAEQLLDAAGWVKDGDSKRSKDGVPLKFTMSTFKGHEAGEQLLASAKEWLAAVGIEMEIQIIELAAWIDTLVNSTFEATMSNWDGGIDPDDYGYGMYHSKGGRNRAKYVNPEIDAVLEQGRTELDQEQRKAAYSAFQKIAAEDVPYLPVYHYQHIYAYRSQFSGFVPSPVPADIYRSVKAVAKQ
ncbi:MAG: peptide/nickel transport system substrate-binding protein [Thermomicrobiales bacterium]|nr:peptide/nickel transport system substrate-binding protein [Thermomicrobiales bacterium]